MACAVLALVSAGLAIPVITQSAKGSQPVTMVSSVKFVNSTVNADGVVTAQNQATLHFQTAGKLTYLPLKEGDKVQSGQTIASLDSYTIQKQLEQALNNYRSVRDTFDQTQNNVLNNVQKAQLTNPTNNYSKAGMGMETQENAINDAVKRIVDQNQANLDNSVINVQIANYAFQMASVTSPLNGILLHEDVKVAGQNITPATGFVVADPATAVFRANIPATMINYVTVGAPAEIAIDGMKNKITGTVATIYPSKITLQSGQTVYQVDIQSDQVVSQTKLDQAGTAMIKTNAEHVALVPAWCVLGGNYIWVDNNGKPELKKITAGKIHGQEIEVTGGLTPQDKIIINPEYIQSHK